MKTILIFLITFSFFLKPLTASALGNKAWSVGFSYLSKNFLNEITNKEDGSVSFLGTSNYALDGGYEDKLVNDWYWTGRLLYTPLPRSAEGDSASITLTHLKFLFGQNFQGNRASDQWDWFLGLGILREEIKGKGGFVQLSNGTGTSTFAVPGNSSSNINGTQSVGVGYSSGPYRLVTELAFENLFKESKRTQSLVISFLYSFQQSSSPKGRK